ncbi:MAG: DUF418 domain-containing protein [Rikenellaceae bacterium]
MTTNLNPNNSRIDVADVLRGLSVVAILLLHSIEHFNFYSFPDTSEQCAFLNFMDKAVWDGMFFAFGGKAYAIFAMLFGFSFYIQDRNQTQRGRDFRLRFCWRLILLLVIGNINAIFFTAEVLVLFALVGFVLPLTCRLSDKTLLVIAAVCLVQPVALYYTIHASLDPEFVTPAIATRSYWAACREMQSGGTFLEMARVNLVEGQIASLAWAWDNGRFFQTAALFIIGMLVGRRSLFEEQNLKVWYWVGGVALLCFFPLSGLTDMLPKYIESKSILVPLKLILSSLSKFSFMLLLVSAVLILYYKTAAQKRMRGIISYGKMSLTNYISQSFVGAVIFYNWGFGLHDNLTITMSILVGVVLVIVQIWACNWWMRSHKQGPLEYLWKRATWL